VTAAKAWVAGLFMILTALVAALSDDVVDMNDTQQVIASIVAAVAGIYAVYQTRNRPKGPLS
jgi:hypothetical protein